jgi:O-antigen/teichoic acid export membrane protein
MLYVRDNISKVKNLFVYASNRGFFHIIISSSLVKIVSFISAMFLPRFLSKADYGLLTYVDNIRDYIMLINGIGIANATLRYCAKEDTDENKKGYFVTTLIVGILFDLILIIITIIAFVFMPFPFDGAKTLLLLMSFLPLFAFLLDDIQLLLRACFENKMYSVLSFLYTALMVILQIGLAIIWRLNGIIVGRYLAVILCVIIGIIFIMNMKTIQTKAIMPDKGIIIGMIKFGFVMLAANTTSLVMQLNETFIIGQILKSEAALADYKVASYILTISLFLLQSVVIFVFPFFVKHMDDKQWIWNKFKKIFYYNALIMIPIHIMLFIFAKLFIIVIFGANYINAVPIMRVLLVASLGQALFRGLTGNILAGIGEEKYNLNINIFFAVFHVLIDIWAIKTFGLNGAAVALTVVYFSSGIVMTVHLRNVCKVNKVPNVG